MQSVGEEVWTPASLLSRLERREKFFVFDVRNRDEFERFRLEGRIPLPALNLPYFELLESGGKDDMVESIVACVERDLRDKLPAREPILAVCAKGGTSEFVAQALRQVGYPCVNLEHGMKGWGEYYAVRTVLESGDLSVYQVSRPARGCLSYVIASGEHANVIDPLRHLEPYLSLAKQHGSNIERVIDTHGHADHVSGGPALAAATGATYHLHPYDAVHPIDMLPATLNYDAISANDTFRIGPHELKVMHVPGHTLGLVALLLDGQYLIAGDSIFVNSVSRPDLGGQAESWARLHTKSLRRLLNLPGSTRLLPGHFSSLEEGGDAGIFSATLDELKSSNEGLRTLERDSDDEYVRYLLDSLPKFNPDYVQIKRVNAGLVSPPEEDIETLELGKNVCALSQAYKAPAGGAS
ncbi:MAG TPA: MBL fold metallo-hydrolase [Terriglobales bacterium]|nr:MBL fold metallo-hydrolase [Terriglobales bacterium]